MQGGNEREMMLVGILIEVGTSSPLKSIVTTSSPIDQSHRPTPIIFDSYFKGQGARGKGGGVATKTRATFRLCNSGMQCCHVGSDYKWQRSVNAIVVQRISTPWQAPEDSSPMGNQFRIEDSDPRKAFSSEQTSKRYSRPKQFA